MHLHVQDLITYGGLDSENAGLTPARGTRFLFPVQAASKVFRGSVSRCSTLPTATANCPTTR